MKSWPGKPGEVIAVQIRHVLLGLVVSVGTNVSPLRADIEPSIPSGSIVVYDGLLVGLDSIGSITVWDLKSGTFDKDATKKFAKKDLSRLAVDKDKLWAVNRFALYRWSAKLSAWETIAELDNLVCFGFEIVDGKPFLVSSGKVVDLIGKQTFNMPDKKLFMPGTRITATHGTESMLWIGMGCGEWGGQLLGLDPKTSKWVQKGGDNVSGITHATDNEVLVSWYMSHFTTRCQIKVHHPDGTVKNVYDSLNNNMYQQIAYNSHDKKLYAVNATDVICFEDGKPIKLESLDGLMFEREPKAMGVASGIQSLIPFGPKQMIIVPTSGEPWILQNEKVIRLKKAGK